MTRGDKPILIVEARFYADIADQLAVGASAVLAAEGWAFERAEVPGAFEIPAAISFAESAAGFAGYIALGCVIRGETSHYDIVANEPARALMELATGRDVPLGNGILTCETRAQAELRADPAGKDKGGDAARACLAMVALKARFAAGSVT